MNKITIEEIKARKGSISIQARKGSQFLVLNKDGEPVGTYGMSKEKFLPETINEELFELDVNDEYNI